MMYINPKNIIYLVQVNTNIVGYNMMNANLFPRTLIFLIREKMMLPPPNSKRQASFGSLH